MATYPLATLAAVVSPTGIAAPTYAEIYQSLQASFQSIFGSDAYIDPDSQDGQMLAIYAKALADCNNTAIALYNAYSPQTAQGVGLSNAVKINGLVRASSTSSTALLTIVGQVGTTILNGVVEDANKNRWAMPASVVIPITGTINVTATCQTTGAIAAAAGTITQILNPTLGWQSATNASDANLGAPVEDDTMLRQRQAVSTALPSRTVLDGVVGAVYAVPGVTQVVAYENDTGTTDSNGLPPHSIAVVALGGDSAAIGLAIFVKKTPGAYTYGTTTVSVVDIFGITNSIRYFIPTPITIKVGITIKALTGYTSAIATQLKQSLVDYINALGIGKPVYIPRLYLPAQLYGGQGSETFEVQLLQISINPAAVGNLDLILGFNEIAHCAVSNIALVVV